MWTDRSGSFKVEAEFIGLRDGKIHLHKTNGVKIAVPVSKMAVEDLEYVENATGVSLDEDKPLSDIKRRSTQRQKERRSQPQAGLSKDEYDWFDFFLQCGVNPQICERYASAFSRDSMGQEVLPDVNEQLLRTLGLKEGDILRVMKFLNTKYGRSTSAEQRAISGASVARSNQDDDDITSANGSGSGGLFSGPGGALRNNTRKGRPAPAVQTTDTVDAKAFEQKMESRETPLASAPARLAASGFDDDAWDVKPSRTTTPAAPLAPAPTPVAAPPPAPPKNDDLSLLALPLQPEPTGIQQLQQSAPAPATAPTPAPAQAQAPPTADQQIFDKIAALKAAQYPKPPQPQMQPQQTGYQPGMQQPPRAASAPGFPQQSNFGPPPLQPQMTGFPGPNGMQPQQTGYPQPQQGFNPMQPQQTGFPQQQQGFNQFQNGIMPQPTGFNQMPPQQTGYQGFQPQPTGFQQGYPQQFVTGTQTGSPFADPPRQPFQPTPSGMQNTFSPQQTGFMGSQQTGLPPALQPQQTGMNGFGQPPQQTGGVFGPPSTFAPPPPMPPMPTGMQPLQPQKTGPAPPVRFGVQPAANKLVPQPTGRANLAKASKYRNLINHPTHVIENVLLTSSAAPQNPFGF